MREVAESDTVIISTIELRFEDGPGHVSGEGRI
jgi:hypothetical protein